MTRDAASIRHFPAAPEPGSRWTGLAQRVRTMNDRVHEELSDLTRGKVPILKAIGMVIFIAGLVWWARGLQGSVEAMSTNLSALSVQVGEVVEVKGLVTANQREVESLRRDLASLQEDYKVLELKYERLDKDFAVATARQGE